MLPKKTGRREPSCPRAPSARQRGTQALQDSEETSGLKDSGRPEEQLSQVDRTILSKDLGTTTKDCGDAHRPKPTEEEESIGSHSRDWDSGFEKTSANPACFGVATPDQTVTGSVAAAAGETERGDSFGDEFEDLDESNGGLGEVPEIPVVAADYAFVQLNEGQNVQLNEQGMAHSNRKFERPSFFSGLASEDVLEWVDTYSNIGDFNGWSCKDKHDHIFMYLKGSAGKWWRGLTPKTTTWLDVTTTVNGLDVVTKGTRSRLLESFQIGNHKQFYASKLQYRTQGENESAVDYYYDIIALCASVDAQMSEEEKVNHLLRGIGPDLTRAIYSRLNEIRRAEDFLRMIRREEEGMALAMVKKRGKTFPLAGMTTDQPTKYESFWNSADQNVKRDGNETPLEELRHQRRALEDQIEAVDELIRERDEATRELANKAVQRDNDRKPRWGEGRDPDISTILRFCFRCSKVGHMGRDCPNDGDEQKVLACSQERDHGGRKGSFISS